MNIFKKRQKVTNLGAVSVDIKTANLCKMSKSQLIHTSRLLKTTIDSCRAAQVVIGEIIEQQECEA